jgi:hypothetical protein
MSLMSMAFLSLAAGLVVWMTILAAIGTDQHAREGASLVAGLAVVLGVATALAEWA